MSKQASIAVELRRAIARAERAGTSRYQIAKAAKIHQSQIHRIADGKTVPILTTAERIAKAIGCRLMLAK